MKVSAEKYNLEAVLEMSKLGRRRDGLPGHEVPDLAEVMYDPVILCIRQHARAVMIARELSRPPSTR